MAEARSEARVERRLAAILAADVVGYSRLMATDEAGTHARLKALRKELIEPRITEHGGRTVKLMGDGALVEFPSVVEAVQCAVELQQAVAERNLQVPEPERIAFRVGINSGDVIIEPDDIYGDGVNVAARMESLAEPGGICISGKVYDEVRHKLDLGFSDLGEQPVKNIPEPVRAHRVLLDPAAAATAPPTLIRHRWWAGATVGVLLLASIGILGWLRPWQPDAEQAFEATAALPLPEKPSIAVLPFDNLSGDPEQEYFAEGMAEDLITDLSKISGLFVIARNSSFAYEGQSPDVREVARELGVRYVLEGSVRRAGEQLRINAQLIDATTGGHVWAERFDGALTDVFVLQDEITRSIVDALAVQLTNREQHRVTRLPTHNLEAYDYYLRAEQGTYTGDLTEVFRATALYQKAIALDGEFAEAYGGLARASVDALRYDFDLIVPGPLARKSAYQAAAKAVELEPDLPRPYSVLSLLQMLDGEHDEAIATARRAVALAPNDAEAHINLALVLAYAGLPGAAVEQAETALRLNPKPPPGFLLIAGLALILDRQYERATELLERVHAAVPSSATALEFLAMSYAQVGRLDAAQEKIDQLLRVDPNWSLAFVEVRYAHHRRPEDIRHRREALRKAGMPQWPLGFEGRPEDRLEGRVIRHLIEDGEWQGRFLEQEAFFLAFSNDGSFALRTETSFRTGTAWVRGDGLCLAFVATALGRPQCGPVYRNPSGTSAENNEYIYAGPAGLFEFSVVG